MQSWIGSVDRLVHIPGTGEVPEEGNEGVFPVVLDQDEDHGKALVIELIDYLGIRIVLRISMGKGFKRDGILSHVLEMMLLQPGNQGHMNPI
jgi:hypothetical protein